MFAAFRTSDIVSTAASLAFKGDFIGARDELSQVLDEFYERAGDALKDIGVDCAVDLVQSIIKKPLAIIKIGVAFLTWVPVVIFDYFKYGGQPTELLLIYTPSGFGPDTVWNGDFFEFQNCYFSSASPPDCIVSVMQASGASPQAIEFTELLEWDAYMSSFEEYGIVDLAGISYPVRANDNFQYVLVNGKPQIVHVEDVWSIDIRQDSNYPALAQQYPNLTVWGGDNSFVSMEQLPEGGQRFIFSYALVDYCHACQTGHSAVIAFDFDNTGQFLGTTLLYLE